MSTQKEQLDLFVALVGDVPLRDDREMMSAPMVSIAKKGQERIEWQGPSGQQVVITSTSDDGIATIWDFDVVIWAISQLNAAVERGETPSPIISFRPYDLMKSIGWCDNMGRVGGRDYERFKAAVSRLRATRIRTSLRRRGKDRFEDFNLLSEFLLDEKDGRPLGARMTVPAWIHSAVTESRRDVLSITPLYFELTSGIDRFLYRLARRHAGNGLDNPDGWVFSFRDLHKRSGSSMRYADFAKALRRAHEKQAIPTYELIEERGANGDPLMRMRFRSFFSDPVRRGHLARVFSPRVTATARVFTPSDTETRHGFSVPGYTGHHTGFHSPGARGIIPRIAGFCSLGGSRKWLLTNTKNLIRFGLTIVTINITRETQVNRENYLHDRRNQPRPLDALASLNFKISERKRRSLKVWSAERKISQIDAFRTGVKLLRIQAEAPE